MTDRSPPRTSGVSSTVINWSCPTWCVTDHGALLAEEDWVHAGEPLPITGDTHARLCMSIHPATGIEDGPYVLIGVDELTLPQAAELACSLLVLTTQGASRLSRPSAP